MKTLFSFSFPSQASVCFDIHSELLRKEGAKEEIVVPFKIFELDGLKVEPFQPFQNRKIFGERKGFSETEEEFEKVAQDHQMAHPLLFRVQEPEKNFHLLRRTSINRTVVFTTDRGKFRGDVLARVRQIMRGEDAPLVDGPDD